MAIVAFILGLLALGVMRLIQALGTRHGTLKADQIHSLQGRRSAGSREEGGTGGTFAGNLSPEGLHAVRTSWHGARERFGRKDKRAKAVAFSLALAVLLGVPGTALADDGGNVWGPQALGWDDGDVMGVMTVADNQYNAALFALGYDPNDSDTFNEVVKAKLSNESTGSSFYTFAQLFRTGQPLWFPNYENISGVYFTVVTLYGAERVFSAQYETVHALQARVALEAVLNGGDSGGGSGGGTATQDGFYKVTLTATNPPWSGNDVNKKVNVYADPSIRMNQSTGVGYGESFGSIVGNVTYNSANELVGYVDQYTYDLMSTYNCVKYVRSFGSNYILAGDGDFTWIRGNNDSNYFLKSLGASVVYGFVPRNNHIHSELYQINGKPSACYFDVKQDGTYRFNSSGVNTEPMKAFWVSSGGYVSDPPVGDWPVPVDPHIWVEPPVPDPPEPTSPVITDDPIYLPDPTMPIPSPEDGPTYTTPDLSAVLDAMNRHCIHLQNAIYGAASQFWGLLSSKMNSDLSAFTSWLGDWLEVIADNITDGILHLENYLHSLAVWLAEQFDYSITSSEYNDGSVVAWLKRIWAKLGTGSINTRPDDPVADPIGIGDWLGSFFAGLLNDLKGLIDSILGEFGTDLETLITKFPISIPWDVAIVLGALVAPPQVPHIEYPMYTVGMGGLEYVTDVVIDLSDWSDVMGVIRNFELLTFGGFLAMKTKHFMELMEGVDV